jgi:hypothetical protein
MHRFNLISKKDKMIMAEYILDIATEYFGQCRICRFWKGNIVIGKEAKCNCPDSEFYEETTSTGGFCSKWKCRFCKGSLPNLFT